jgi:hypothetical protein
MSNWYQLGCGLGHTSISRILPTPLPRQHLGQSRERGAYLLSNINAAQEPTPPHPTTTTYDSLTFAMASSPKKL